MEETLGLVLTALAGLSKYKNRMGSIVLGQDDVLGRTVCSVSENREERQCERRGKGKSGEPQMPVQAYLLPVSAEELIGSPLNAGRLLLIETVEI